MSGLTEHIDQRQCYHPQMSGTRPLPSRRSRSNEAVQLKSLGDRVKKHAGRPRPWGGGVGERGPEGFWPHPKASSQRGDWAEAPRDPEAPGAMCQCGWGAGCK